MSSSAAGSSFGLLALGGIASLALLSQRFRSNDSNQTGRSSSTVSTEAESSSSAEASPLVLTQEVSIWPQLTAALSEATSPGVFRTLDAAALVLRIARQFDPRLQAPGLDAYYAQLGVIERARMKDFAGTKMVVVEGLSGSGKSTLIHGLTSLSSTYPVGSVEHSPLLLSVQGIFASMPEPVLKAFEFSTNYFTAYAIASSEHKVALVERFYHAICAHTVCDVMSTGEDLTQFHPSVFDWPADLPVPDLVIYLHISTDVRLKRYCSRTPLPSPILSVFLHHLNHSCVV